MGDIEKVTVLISTYRAIFANDIKAPLQVETRISPTFDVAMVFWPPVTSQTGVLPYYHKILTRFHGYPIAFTLEICIAYERRKR